MLPIVQTAQRESAARLRPAQAPAAAARHAPARPRWRAAAGILAALAMTALAGCAPRLEIVGAECRPVRAAAQTQDGMAFVVTIDTSGYTNQQLLYRVRVLDSRLRPIPSVTRSFADADGHVAATKSLMVLRSPWTFEQTVVAIPRTELELRAEHLPAHAEFAVLTPGGEVLAREIRRVPIAEAPPMHDAPAVARGHSADMPPEPTASAAEQAQAAAGADDLFSLLYEAYQRDDLAAAAAPDDLAASAAPTDAATASPPAPTADSDPAPSQAERLAERGGAAPSAAPAEGEEQAPPPAPARGQHRLYVVQPGDTLTRIAKRLYGDTARWVDIFQLNRDQLDSPDLIYEGMEIRVPSDD